MKFVAITYGTEGDTRPMALLCRALMDAGHSACLLADASTLESATALGVPVGGLAGDIRAVLGQDTAIVGRGGGFGDTTSAFARIGRANSEAWLRATVTAAEGCDAIILAGLAAFTGLSAAEFLGVPAVGAGLIPITPTREFPSPFLPPGRTPRWLNRASHNLVNELIWRAFRTPINDARAAVCRLPPRRRLWTDHPMLYGISPTLAPQPADWPKTARMCGQWLAPAKDWSPPESLGEFLSAGEPPIYLGFGSMGAFSGGAMIGEALAALRGRRALFYPGWGAVTAADLPPNVHLLSEVPHGWLFPRTALAIHHGGAGTAHAAARAGIPSVAVPFAGDQFFWAERLRLADAAPGPVPAKELSASRLARAIDEADSEALRRGAAVLATSIAREDGLKTAVAAIEALTQRAPRTRAA
ncbi:MAG TPA: glycosyltransferase [Caulobacteraceae bacterium]|jgi:UDP:flavonoid glycosyltransferase YjiC (YdhE family)